jgi:aromatic-amino-acid transaminase
MSPTSSLLPDRICHRPEDDPIFALNREASARRAKGEKIINATVGSLLEDDGKLAVLPAVVEALHQVPAATGAAYAPILGHPDFLKAVTEDLLGGTPLAARAVAVATAGGLGALRHAVSLFTEHRHAVVTSSFFWGPYTAVCDEQERALRTFTMFDERGAINCAALERACQEVEGQGRLLVVLNDPCHNPSGYSMSEADWTGTVEVLTRVARRVPLVVLVDMAYLVYARDRNRHFLRHLEPLTEHAIVSFAWSASKAFTQYGLRVGALIACTKDAAVHQPLRNAFLYSSRGTWSNVNAAGQHAITRCLTDPALRARVETERARIRTLLHARVDAFNAAARGTGLKFPRYEGGFFICIYTDQAEPIAERLKEHGIYVVPQKGALRIALCSVAEADIPRLVETIDNLTHDPQS